VVIFFWGARNWLTLFLFTVILEHYGTLQDMAKHFTFSVVNANASIEQVRADLLKEFSYQSSLELAEKTFALLSRIPFHKTITSHARQSLVQRLDNYRAHNGEMFSRVLDAIVRDFIPTIRMFALTGSCVVESTDPLWNNTFAISMAVDALTERGYLPTVRKVEHSKPIRVDLKTGEIETKTWHSTVFEISFQKGLVRAEEAVSSGDLSDS
jgi:adenylate kinase